MSQFDFSRVVTTGSSGLVGSYVDFGIRTTKATLDILDQVAVLKFAQEHRPQAIIHLAAATDTKKCETQPSYAYGLNTAGTLNVALAAEAVGAVMVYVSTSRVFDGVKELPYTEEDTPNPSNTYGKSKYLGELITSTVVSKYIIVRGCWMFGGGPDEDTKFFGSVLRQLGNDQIIALNDVFGSPTYAKDFVSGLKKLLAEEARGIRHLCNYGSVTRAEIVNHILTLTQSKSVLQEVNRSYFPGGNLLPTNEAMFSDQIKLRPWQEAFNEYFDTEWKNFFYKSTI